MKNILFLFGLLALSCNTNKKENTAAAIQIFEQLQKIADQKSQVSFKNTISKKGSIYDK